VGASGQQQQQQWALAHSHATPCHAHA
jgi:hypothetical protein